MPADDDLKSHALNSAHDFYELIGVHPGASDSEIRRAYRKTALKYHPDKNAGKPDVIEKFHLLQIAYDVLSDATVKELYDNARRARQEKKDREQAFEGRRKWMKEDLERRESGAVKRKREEADEEETFERELRRLAEDGKRRRREREEVLRKEVQAEQEMLTRANVPVNANGDGGEVPEMDRSITLRFAKNETTKDIDQDTLSSTFSRFGAIDEVVLRDKKIKVEGEKHRVVFSTAVLVFKSIVGAHAAVVDVPVLQGQGVEEFIPFQQVTWAGGKEPDCIPKTPQLPVAVASPQTREISSDMSNVEPTPPSTPICNSSINAPSNLRKVPSFASFKGTPRGPGTPGTPSADDITKIRLKNAERRRLEAKIRKEEEDAAVTAAA
nr:pre-mrna-splicing factor cwf23 [Quercus suber]